MKTESVPKIIINNTINLFLKTTISILLMSNRNSFSLIKLLPYILFEKIYLYFSIENGQPREPAPCRLYRHTFVPYYTTLPRQIPMTRAHHVGTLPVFRTCGSGFKLRDRRFGHTWLMAMHVADHDLRRRCR